MDMLHLIGLSAEIVAGFIALAGLVIAAYLVWPDDDPIDFDSTVYRDREDEQ